MTLGHTAGPRDERSDRPTTMGSVRWEALEQWGDDVARLEPLTGGVGVNEVWSVRINGHLAVGRLGARSDADLAPDEELDLIARLADKWLLAVDTTADSGMCYGMLETVRRDSRVTGFGLK